MDSAGRNSTRHTTAARLSAILGVTALLAGCATQPAGEPAPVPTGTGTPTATAEPLALPSGDPVVIATGLTSPWSIARLASGSTLVSERDTALVKEITADGSVRVVGEVAGVVPGGEGGLLGLAVLGAESAGDGTSPSTRSGAGLWLYAYFTGADDNRIVRMPLGGEPGAYAIGAAEPILTGITKAGNHNGGRIAFGPDGMLYATTGDASVRDAAQDPDSLNGKVLRMTPAGAAPDDNPFTGTLVYSLGHRNPQGIAWDDSGQLWAAEFGQDTWDELNAIEAEANYGWPVVEGVASDPAFTNPVAQWGTDDASPSGLAFTRGAFYLAALKGQRLWSVTTADGVATQPWFEGVYGRIRDVTPGPDGTLWMLTSNTDGRGSVQEGDDKLIEVPLGTVAPG
ncbi:PQQ-dependent sugar dehydrogenase [Conyzicola lurida]